MSELGSDIMLILDELGFKKERIYISKIFIFIVWFIILCKL